MIYVDAPKHPESPTVERNWTASTISLRSKVLLVVTKVPIKASEQYSLKTEIGLYNGNVKAALVNGSECWRVTKGDEKGRYLS